MSFSTVFVASQQAPAPEMGAYLGAAIGGAGLIFALFRLLRSEWSLLSRIAVSSLLGAVLSAVAFFSVTANQEARARAIASVPVQVVEGVVQNFHSMPYAGHDTERFQVAGRDFAYSDYVVTGGFNNTSSHGGPIREGQLVRISYIVFEGENLIVKLEVSIAQHGIQPDGPASGGSAG